MIVITVLLAFAPALFWMWWYYRQDLYEKEPKRLLALVFLLAMPFSVLAGLIEYLLDGGLNRLSANPNFLVTIGFYFLIVGPVEELAKFVVVITIAYPKADFNEPVDGIIYAAAAALGFATFENVFYLLDQGPLIIVLRGPVSTLGHVLFSAMWGAALGLARFDSNRRRRYLRIGRGLIFAAFTHGIFNILIATSRFADWLPITAVIFLTILYYLVSQRIAYALDLSQFKPHNPATLIRGLRRGTRSLTSNYQREPVYVPNPHSYRFNGTNAGEPPDKSERPEPPNPES